jgi:hypothetical protein
LVFRVSARVLQHHGNACVSCFGISPPGFVALRVSNQRSACIFIGSARMQWRPFFFVADPIRIERAIPVPDPAIGHFRVFGPDYVLHNWIAQYGDARDGQFLSLLVLHTSLAFSSGHLPTRQPDLATGILNVPPPPRIATWPVQSVREAKFAETRRCFLRRRAKDTSFGRNRTSGSCKFARSRPLPVG